LRASNDPSSAARGLEAKNLGIACAVSNCRNLTSVSLHRVLPLTLPTIPLPLEHLVNGLPKEEGDLRPSPPEHPEQNLENGKGKKHVRGIQKMLDKERHRGDGENGEDETWDKGEEKQENRRPERDLGLRCRQFAAPAMGTRLGIAGVHMQPRAELDVIAPAAEVAEQGLADSDAIAVVTIFHRDV
jgi:hypothetical protein